MTLKIFEKILREKCKELYKTLRSGERQKKLINKNINSLTDIVHIGRKNKKKLFQSCIITYGTVLERATMSYAKEMGAKIYKNKKFLASDIDIVFSINPIVYNLESKSNIELDLGKTKKALETLKRKHKIVFNALDCQNDRLQVISKFVVWTKETSDEAEKTAKSPIKKQHLMGFKDFFKLFNINVEKQEFLYMLQNVWIEEVEAYF